MKDLFQYYRKKKKWTGSSPHHDFDSSSVGDLAFLLLIFFIVTSSFILRQGIFLSLPSKTAGSIKVEEKQLVNIYPTNSSFMVEGSEISREELKKMLIAKKNTNRLIIAVIIMKDDVKYDRLIDALSISRESGIKRVSLKNASEVE